MCTPCKWIVSLGAILLFVTMLAIATGHAQDKPPFPPCVENIRTEYAFNSALKSIETKEVEGTAVRYQGKEAEAFLSVLISLTNQTPPEMFDEVLVFVHDDPSAGANVLFGKDGCVKNMMLGWPRKLFDAIQEEMKGKRT